MKDYWYIGAAIGSSIIVIGGLFYLWVPISSTLLRTFIIYKLRKVVIVFCRDTLNLYSLVRQVFKLITLGSFPFERWLFECLNRKLLKMVKKENLP